jgi:hypothetical protein
MSPFQQAVIRELLDGYPLANLDAGKPREAVQSTLTALSIDSLFAPREVVDRSMAACCISGLWLWHNYLDESHKICQEIETSAGSAWHGLMHRREGDFWNANYWFARVRDRSLFSAMAKEFTNLGYELRELPPTLRGLLAANEWSSAEFTHVVEKVLKEKRADEIEAALKLATAEWRVLFENCWFTAIGMKRGGGDSQ